MENQLNLVLFQADKTESNLPYLKLMMMWMWVSLLLNVVVMLLQLLLLHPVVAVLMLARVGLGLELDPAGLLGGRDGSRRRDHHLLIGGRCHGDLRRKI